MEIRLDWLLGTAWLTRTLPILVASIPFSRLKSFHDLLLGFAKRGKTLRKSSHTAPLGSDSLDYSMAASHLTGGSQISSLHKSHVSTAQRRYEVIYVGLLVTSGGTDITLWLLLLFLVANLMSAAADTQRWYMHKFDSHPQNRRAIIPYVY